ncbi:hypothetical protein QE450_001713 [Paenibacillus sp. SORGH_AS306]|uniref:hypothetical protein n=1 Tax=unclassified Paenibacillus TaxID=185978 RepID=UPI002786F00B|nr:MULTISPECIES: hypothetical protein [unclassified Paenibacillus]MDQ1234215.1 hypothetical protein [Paenibacillus sp. SORGH_AS_0306]MDR6111260.1 hypothetical protein [Paenibacillus sp. SORGH_AS_0338]
MKSIASFYGNTLTNLKDISEVEFQYFVEHSERINKFVNNYKRISIVKKDKEVMNKFIIDYLDDANNIDTASFLSELPSLLLKYLASFKSFLDHWETHLKRLYGNDSNQVKEFKASTAVEFDSYFSYRFVYELRNFTLHCDFPISKVHTMLDENENKLLSVIVNRDRLMSDYKWPNKVKLNEMEQEFDLLPHIEQAFKCLLRIHQTAINLYDTNKLVESALIIYKFKIDYKDVVGDIALVTIEDKLIHLNSDSLDFKINNLPVKEAEKILEMFVRDTRK